MNNQQAGLILLVKSAVTEQKYNLPKGFDIAEAFALATKHSVGTMAYYGACSCGTDKKSDAMKSAFTAVCRDYLRTENQMEQISLITEAFKREKIKYMALKGIHLRSLYPRAEMRRMGDADILVDLSQYEKIRKIMSELGFSEGDVSDHELKWAKPSLYVELHKRLIPSYNKDYYAYFGDGWNRAAPAEVDSTEYVMTPEDEFVYLFTHFAKHYRDAGIGIRHITDLWVFRRSYPALSEEYIRKNLEKLMLSEFYANILDTIGVWFEDGAPTEKTDFITEVIFHSGSFGTKAAHMTSDALKDRKKSKSLTAMKLKRVLGRVFVGYGDMCGQYPILKKAPVLLPFMWVAYLFRRLFEKNKVRNYTKDFLDFTGKDLDDYQKALNYVGLDYNFIP